jgi:hypothetical protein
MLVLHAMRGEAAIFIPGAADTVAAMYEKLRWPSIETRWFRLLSPSVTGALHAITGRAAMYDSRARGAMRITAAPTEEPIDACIEAFNGVATGAVMRPYWALLAWSYSSRAELNDVIAKLGWRPIENAPRSFLYRRRVSSATPAAVNASAGDFGFESILDHR